MHKVFLWAVLGTALWLSPILLVLTGWPFWLQAVIVPVPIIVGMFALVRGGTLWGRLTYRERIGEWLAARGLKDDVEDA
jgi:hypothetical protein